jgi:hypothetical protein
MIPLGADEPELARTMAASVQQRIAFGGRAGQKVRRIGAGFGYAGERPALTGIRCASVHGFSLHANVAVPAHRRDQLERLIRYTARGAVSLERLEADANGDLLFTFTRPWSDGATGITRSPLDLLEQLAALVPLPRLHLVRYGGCLAPHSQLRRRIPPTPRQQGVDAPEADRAGAGLPRPLRMDLALTTPRLFLRALGAGRGRGAPAPRHAGRVWRARARERHLSGQTEGFFGSEGWFLTPREGCGHRMDAKQALKYLYANLTRNHRHSTLALL